jgi:hypothetical protein
MVARRPAPVGCFVGGQQFRCLMLGMCGCHLRFRHGVSAFAHEVFINRQVIVLGGYACHSAGPSAG